MNSEAQAKVNTNTTTSESTGSLMANSGDSTH